MHRLTEIFAQKCKENLDLNNSNENLIYTYRSLPICIIDCVFSLRANYNKVAVPIVDRYAKNYLDGDKNKSGDTVSALIQHINELGGTEKFNEKVIKNHQISGGNKKVDVCYKLAKYLQYLHIDTLEDFRDFESPELLEIVIRGVKGIGEAGTNYLFMLTGDTDRCKPDVQVHRCIKEYCKCDIGDEECQELFRDTVKCLKKQYPNLTVRGLDSIIWSKFQDKNSRS